MNNFFKQFCVWILISATALSVPSTAFAQVNHNDLAKDRTVIINKEPVTPAKLKEWKLGDVKTGEAFTAGKPKQLSRASTGTASFNGLNDVIPKTKDDDSEKPAGYVTITFKIVMGGGKISNKETTVYYVKPNTPVTLPTPKTEAYTGYVFDQWLFVGIKYSPNEPRSYTVDRDIKGRFKSLNHFYPSTDENGEPNAKPPGYVTVTFTDGENGKITSGKTVYYVNPKVKLKLEYLILASRNGKNRPIVTPDVGYKFESWLFGGSRVIDEDLIIPAIYTEEEAIIPERKDDGTKNKKPNGYMTVTFKTTDKAGSVEKAVFINPNKAVKLEGYAPDVNPITGYDFAGWNRPVSEKIQYADGDVITAQFNEKSDVIPREKPDGSDKPAGYLTVTFVKGDYGEVSGKTIYYVKPNTEVTVPAPTVKAATGWRQKPGTDAWDQPLTQAFTKDTTITAQYDPLADVIPQEKTDGSDKPDGYVTLTFDKGEHGELSGKTVYYVKPGKEVTVPAPTVKAATGWRQKPGTDAWDQPLTQAFTKDTTITAQYDPLADVIPQKKTGGSDKPEGYVTLTFDKGVHGKEITGQAVYYVNPNADKTLADITKPTVTKTETGWKQKAAPDAWDTKDDFEIKADKTVKAQYEPIADVVPKDNPQGGENEKPDGYITVTFKTTEKGGNVEKVVYINPNKAVKLGGYAPEVNPITGYDFAGWNRPVSEKIQYADGDVITAQFNEKSDVIPQEKPDGSDKPAGYFTVTFDKGEHGELSGTTVYYVKPGKEVTVTAPSVTPATDYVFDKWDQPLTQKFTAENTTITAEYSKRPFEPTITADTVITTISKLPTKEDYKHKIQVPGEDFEVTKILEEPDVSKSGTSVAEVKIKFANGEKKIVRVSVFVESGTKIIENPVPGNCNNSCDQPNKPNQPNQPNIGMDALNTRDHYQYLIGYPDGNFAPNRGMTRAEVATMFTRLLRQRPVRGNHYNAGFGDIHAGDWYANTVGYAVQRGIVSGYPDGSFKPNKPITRAEFAAIASRFDALAQGNDIAFSDLTPSHWGYAAIRSAASKGWITGYPDNTFRPEQAITRAEVTSITNRMLNRHADLYWIDAHRAEVIRFGDVKRSDWYFEPIMEATMGHDFIRDRDMKTEHWTGLNGKSFI